MVGCKKVEGILILTSQKKFFLLIRFTLNIFLLGKKKGGKEYDVSLLDLLMYLKTSDLVLKANTAGYIMHLTFDDEDAKRQIRYLLIFFFGRILKSALF